MSTTPMDTNSETTLRISPRGWLYVRLTRMMGHQPGMGEFNALWTELAALVGTIAAENGYPDGLPALVFGGDEPDACVMVQQQRAQAYRV